MRAINSGELYIESQHRKIIMEDAPKLLFRLNSQTLGILPYASTEPQNLPGFATEASSHQFQIFYVSSMLLVKYE